MVWSRWAAASVAALLIALVPAGLALHEHEADAQAGQADCYACHFQHLSGIVTDGASAPSAPGLVAHAVAPAPDGERAIAIGIRPTRGPPA